MRDNFADASAADEYPRYVLVEQLCETDIGITFVQRLV